MVKRARTHKAGKLKPCKKKPVITDKQKKARKKEFRERTA